MTVDIVNETTFTVDASTMNGLAAHVLDAMKVHPDADLTVVFVDEPAMEKLHIEWMDDPGPTDVLSFPMDELRPGSDEKPTDPGLLGDVVICPTVAERQAVTAGHSTEAEIRLLLTHGILHLLGFDHAEPEEEKAMFAVQRQLLESFAASHD
ncbi:MAG: rRNA maturation RNase YbeY [Microbacteriaceae bacterium]